MDKLIRKIKNKDKITKLSLEMQCFKKQTNTQLREIEIGLFTEANLYSNPISFHFPFFSFPFWGSKLEKMSGVKVRK